MVVMMDNQPNMYDEHPDIAFNGSFEESVVKRPAGYISVLKSHSPELVRSSTLVPPRSLEQILSSREIKSLVLCGVSTSGCVLSTARAAGDEEFIVTIIEDACMDPVPGLHDTLIQKVLPSQAHITTVSEFQEQWDKVKTV
jgi:nicotinamidase-related amidase